MQESSRLPKTRTNFANDGTISEKQDMLQEINQQLLSNEHTLTLGQVMHLALDLKQYVVCRVSPSNEPTHPQASPFDVGLIAIDYHMVVIPMNVGKNIMEDVLLDGG